MRFHGVVPKARDGDAPQEKRHHRYVYCQAGRISSRH
jgi:hypothetical protein